MCSNLFICQYRVTRILLHLWKGILWSNLHVLPNSDICVSLLITYRSRVAPLSSQFLPQSEFYSALLLADVLLVVLNNIKLQTQKTVAWTDSTITWAWFASESYRWQLFMEKRVAKIHSTIPSMKWCHVPGTSDPADFGTRSLLLS